MVCGLVVLARAIWRWYRPATLRGRAADPDGLDDEFVDLG